MTLINMPELTLLAPGKAAEGPGGLLLTFSFRVPFMRPDIPEARLLLGDRTALAAMRLVPHAADMFWGWALT